VTLEKKVLKAIMVPKANMAKGGREAIAARKASGEKKVIMELPRRF